MTTDLEKLNLSSNFRQEQNTLLSMGLGTWNVVAALRDEELNSIVKKSHSTLSNLKRIRGIARLVCELDIESFEASLLLHAGISSVKSLSLLNPEDLIRQTGRLERILNTRRAPLLDLARAKYLINKAKEATS